jgi:hypothetical protein
MDKWPTPFRIQRFLRGLRYPADKERVIAHARERGAEQDVIRALQTLGERTYESPVVLATSIGGAR